jgi:hypothetical protein
MKACVRLALFLSALWLVGLGIYAGLAWSRPWEIPAPFIYEAWNGQVGPWSSMEYRFNWGLFAGVFCAGGVATIWLLTVGIAWVVAGFRSQKRAPDIPLELPLALPAPALPRTGQHQPGLVDERDQPRHERNDGAIRSPEMRGPGSANRA